MPGPAPKAPSKRRRTNKPVSYGAANPTTIQTAGTAPPDLGFEPPVHPLVESMWAALGASAEARFFSAADWQRARMELFFANSWMTLGTPIPGAVWHVVQNGLSAMLVSPVDKRRLGIEMAPATADADENAAILTMVRYQEKLKSE